LDRYVVERSLHLNDVALQDAMNGLLIMMMASVALLESFLLCRLMQEYSSSEVHSVPNIIVIGMVGYCLICELQKIQNLLQA
jgi:hypothetical protein